MAEAARLRPLCEIHVQDGGGVAGDLLERRFADRDGDLVGRAVTHDLRGGHALARRRMDRADAEDAGPEVQVRDPEGAQAREHPRQLFVRLSLHLLHRLGPRLHADGDAHRIRAGADFAAPGGDDPRRLVRGGEGWNEDEPEEREERK